MHHQNNDPALALVATYKKTQNRDLPVTSYIWKVLAVVIVYAMGVVVAIYHVGTVNSGFIAVACFTAAAATAFAALIYVYERNQFAMDRAELLHDVRRDTLSVSLRQWPMCFDALVHTGVIKTNRECTVSLHSGSKQADVLADYLSHAIPHEQSVKSVKAFVPLSMIKEVEVNLRNEALARKQDFLTNALEVFDMSEEEACRLRHGAACNYPNGCA